MTSAKKALLITTILTLGVTTAASARSPWDGDRGGWYQHGSSSGYGQRNRGYNDWFGGGRNNAWGNAFGDAMSDVVGDFFGDAEFDMEFKIRASARGKGKGKGKGRGRGRGDARGYSQGRGYSGGQYHGNYYGNGYYDSRFWGGPAYNSYGSRYPY